jgi:F-type H+-transporting ATPase subunit gamma
MSDTAANLNRKMGTAGDLQSVVRTMKTVAASSIGQYENAVCALDDYYRTVQLGLVACLCQGKWLPLPMQEQRRTTDIVVAVVFGSDQGLVGQFNDVMANLVEKTLEDFPNQTTVWTVGERIRSRLGETNLHLGKSFSLPGTIGAITVLVGQILIEIETLRDNIEIAQVAVFHNSPHVGAICGPCFKWLLPLDETWRRDLTAQPWPTKNLPEVMNGGKTTLLAFVREYLFVSLFKACAESLTSEHASRLVAMQRAEKNIDELLDNLNRSFHRLRQSDIDEELFDVICSFEALKEV